jgi:hypothetical protein
VVVIHIVEKMAALTGGFEVLVAVIAGDVIQVHHCQDYFYWCAAASDDLRVIRHSAPLAAVLCTRENPRPGYGLPDFSVELL